MDHAAVVPKPEVFISAITCREVLIEKTEIPSAIRLVDRIQTAPSIFIHRLANGEPDPHQLPNAVFTDTTLRAVITFHAEAPISFTFTVRIKRPDGTLTNSTEGKEIEIVTPGLGSMLDTTIEVNTKLEGVHWYEFCVDGTPVNKVPLTVSHPLGLQNHEKWMLTEWSTRIVGLPLQAEKN